MYGFYYYDYNYLLYMIVTMSVSMYAHFKVQHAYSKYSKIKNSNGLTGMEVAVEVLKGNGVSGVSIGHVKGHLSDHFDPSRNIINLSDDVCYGKSLAALGVAAHEAGHAVQHAKGYTPIKIRQSLVPVSQFASNISIPMVVLGLLLPVQYSFIVTFGIALFTAVVLFQLVTLPVELNASNRALISLKSSGILEGRELQGAQAVLKAAAFTYVAAAFTSILTLLRLIFIARRRD